MPFFVFGENRLCSRRCLRSAHVCTQRARYRPP
uniref:Extracellular protein R7 n=1 Tax=Toxoplasma gondii TaxID=5811 RepID=Q86LU0_TOXGO|nr:extracellular protein R7 [Toxoplasma gondii]